MTAGIAPEIRSLERVEAVGGRRQPEVLAIGDSILVGVAHLLKPHGWKIDAEVGRNTKAGIERLKMHVEMGQPERIYIGLGTNGGMNEKQLQEILELMGESWKVFCTVKAPRQWRYPTNKLLRMYYRRLEFHGLHDWGFRAAGHPDWFWPDRIHPTVKGQDQYADGALRAVVIEELDFD